MDPNSKDAAIAVDKPISEAQSTPVPAKRRSNQCECCSSQLGDLVRVEGTTRVICNECLGFLFRWLLELETTNEHGQQMPQQ
jgi:hypothetical protein